MPANETTTDITSWGLRHEGQPVSLLSDGAAAAFRRLDFARTAPAWIQHVLDHAQNVAEWHELVLLEHRHWGVIFRVEQITAGLYDFTWRVCLLGER